MYAPGRGVSMPSYNEGRIERLRRDVRARVEGMTLRHVARQVGMTPEGLRRFLLGRDPQTATSRKVERYVARQTPPMGGATAFIVLRALVQDLPPARQPAAVAALARSVEGAVARAGCEPPRWLAEIQPLLTR
jgi:hypothetical protein